MSKPERPDGERLKLWVDYTGRSFTGSITGLIAFCGTLISSYLGGLVSTAIFTYCVTMVAVVWVFFLERTKYTYEVLERQYLGIPNQQTPTGGH